MRICSTGCIIVPCASELCKQKHLLTCRVWCQLNSELFFFCLKKALKISILILYVWEINIMDEYVKNWNEKSWLYKEKNLYSCIKYIYFLV